MRKYGRLDANQNDVKAALIDAGCSVQSLASVGGGCPDLLVGFAGQNFLLEVKDGKKSPSQRALTAQESAWKLKWLGSVSVVYGPDDAVGLVSGIFDNDE